MKTKARRRLLVSSLCMLLVAIVALGTATFAWFTSNTSATASDLSVQTTKSSELKVSKKDLEFKDSISYGVNNKVLRPVTSSDGKNWYSSVAAKKTESTSNGTYTKADLDNYVVVDMLNIKNAGGQTCNNVKITVAVAGTNVSDFARLAIVPCETAQTVAGTMPDITTADFKANIYGTSKGREWKPYDGKALTADNYSTKGVANGAEITVGAMEAGAVKSYKVILWFEGEDTACFDTTTAGLAVPNITFTVTGSTSTTTTTT